MLCEVPLTDEQRDYATEHHALVYKFLKDNHLPMDEFYDVIIFGYLRAVNISISLQRLPGAVCALIYITTIKATDVKNALPRFSVFISVSAQTVIH